MKKSKMLLGVGGVTVGLLGLGVGVAFAGIPGASGSISACRNNLTGGLRVIDAEAGQSCNSLFETGLNWSQTGPQGPAGPQGSSGAMNVEVITDPLEILPGTSNIRIAEAMCPTGKIATGGGFDGVMDFIHETRPIVVSGKPRGWYVRSEGSVQSGAAAYAICASES